MDNKINSIFSKVLKAGKKRTYFFDVRNTRANDYFITITESRRKPDGDGYIKNKVFLYKEDFNKFLDAFKETVDHVKTELLPDFDYDRKPEFSDDVWAPREPATDSVASTEETPASASTYKEDEPESEKLDASPPSDDAKDDKDDNHTSHLFQEDEEKW